jgi:hypothetical protein
MHQNIPRGLDNDTVLTSEDATRSTLKQILRCIEATS